MHVAQSANSLRRSLRGSSAPFGLYHSISSDMESDVLHVASSTAQRLKSVAPSQAQSAEKASTELKCYVANISNRHPISGYTRIVRDRICYMPYTFYTCKFDAYYKSFMIEAHIDRCTLND